MSGLALAVGATAVVATLAVGCATAGAVSVRMARAAGAADAAALAAADAASGAIAGEPCARAAETAQRVGGVLLGCDVDGVVATVMVAVPLGPFQPTARARAGPPG
ncbi:MAG: helicase [Candidatus Microbacterium phytovorans]|uniref:Helicase n=1 Tax=Candidatus Microbacterium phytovorans TaxID=3121374 RepID=A0AAJ5VXU8_9MICO|nr:helicase [Microbacterium sp.]WEK12371.1 MAG: helicase [Microbacterium sp.]